MPRNPFSTGQSGGLWRVFVGFFFFLVCFGCFQLCFSLKNHTKPNKTPTQKRQPKSCGSALKILQIKGSPGQRGPKEQGRAPSTETPSPTDVSGWLSMSPRAWWPPRVSPEAGAQLAPRTTLATPTSTSASQINPGGTKKTLN